MNWYAKYRSERRISVPSSSRATPASSAPDILGWCSCHRFVSCGLNFCARIGDLPTPPAISVRIGEALALLVLEYWQHFEGEVVIELDDDDLSIPRRARCWICLLHGPLHGLQQGRLSIP